MIRHAFEAIPVARKSRAASAEKRCTFRRLENQASESDGMGDMGRGLLLDGRAKPSNKTKPRREAPYRRKADPARRLDEEPNRPMIIDGRRRVCARMKGENLKRHEIRLGAALRR